MGEIALPLLRMGRTFLPKSVENNFPVLQGHSCRESNMIKQLATRDEIEQSDPIPDRQKFDQV